MTTCRSAPYRHVILEVDTCASFWDQLFFLRLHGGRAILDAVAAREGGIRNAHREPPGPGQAACSVVLIDVWRWSWQWRSCRGTCARPRCSSRFEYLPCEVGGWTDDGRARLAVGVPVSHRRCTLIHVHRQWGLTDAVTLDALAGGCDGIMAAVCERKARHSGTHHRPSRSRFGKARQPRRGDALQFEGCHRGRAASDEADHGRTGRGKATRLRPTRHRGGPRLSAAASSTTHLRPRCLPG